MIYCPYNINIISITFICFVGLLSGKLDEDIPLEKQDLRTEGIFGSVNSILDYLKLPKYRSLPTIKEMLKKYRRTLYIGHQLSDYLPGPRRRFVVIEGLYTSKRSSVARLVARTMRGKYIINPYGKMAEVNKLPTTFDTRRAYYLLTKYGIANLVPTMLVTQAVVMERYWLDQASHVVAKTFGSNLPPTNSGLYDWPADLLKPDIMFFINADDKSTERVNTNLPNEINNFTINLLHTFDQYKKVMNITEISYKPYTMSMVKEIMSHIRSLGPEMVTVKPTKPPIKSIKTIIKKPYIKKRTSKFIGNVTKATKKKLKRKKGKKARKEQKKQKRNNKATKKQKSKKKLN